MKIYLVGGSLHGTMEDIPSGDAKDHYYRVPFYGDKHLYYYKLDNYPPEPPTILTYRKCWQTRVGNNDCMIYIFEK